MRRFLAAHHNLIVGVLFSLVGIGLALYLSDQADRRQLQLIEHETQWRTDDSLWFEFDQAKAARQDSLLRRILQHVERTYHAHQESQEDQH